MWINLSALEVSGFCEGMLGSGPWLREVCIICDLISRLSHKDVSNRGVFLRSGERTT